jgi:hypothetical protein
MCQYVIRHLIGLVQGRAGAFFARIFRACKALSWECSRPIVLCTLNRTDWASYGTAKNSTSCEKQQNLENPTCKPNLFSFTEEKSLRDLQLFWDVTQHRLVISYDVSGKPISAIIKVNLEP